MTREVLFAERLICIIVIALSAFCFVETFAFPSLKGDPGGGALFPRIAAGVAFLGSVIVIIRGLPMGGREPVQMIGDYSLSALAQSPTTQTIILSIAYPWFIMKAGFPVATAVYVYILMLILRVPSRIAAPYGILVAGVLYLVFVFALEAYVPVGDWMGWVTE